MAILIGAVALFAGVILVFTVADSYFPSVLGLLGFVLLLDFSSPFPFRSPRFLGGVPRLLFYLSLFVLNADIISMLFSIFLSGSSPSLTASGLTFVIGL